MPPYSKKRERPPTKKKSVAASVTTMAKANNGKQKIKATSRARVGQIIVLKGGRTKNKRRYNKKHAIVKEIPPKGCWMTVKLIQQQQAQKHEDETVLTTLLKWHKSSFHPMSTTDQRTDPLTMLNDESVIKIFSFLIGECPRLDNNEDAKAQTLWLRNNVIESNPPTLMISSSVSKLWHQTITRILPKAIGLIDIDLYTIDHWVSEMVHWLGSNKQQDIQLSSLLVRFAELGDIPYLTQLIQNCNTQNLTHLDLSINSGRRAEATSLASYRKEQLVISLRNRQEEEEERERARLENIHITQLKTFHTFVANQCPNIIELDVALTLPFNHPNYDDYISTSLFSMTSIQRLTLSLGYCYCSITSNDNTSSLRRLHLQLNEFDRNNFCIDSLVVTRIIRNLTGLKSLKLASPNAGYLHQRRFHVESTSLERIDVTGLGKQVMISCTCPKLQSYRCRGYLYGNGTLPILTESQLNNVTEHLDQNNNLVVTAGTYEFPHFVVPDNCEITLLPFCYSDDITRDFTRYNRFAQDAANATFQTF